MCTTQWRESWLSGLKIGMLLNCCFFSWRKQQKYWIWENCPFYGKLMFNIPNYKTHCVLCIDMVVSINKGTPKPWILIGLSRGEKKTIHLGDPPSMEPPMCMAISCRKRHITKSCQTWQPEKIDLCVKEFEEISGEETAFGDTKDTWSFQINIM